MNCEEVQSRLLEYFDKTLDTAMMTRVATHLIACPNCGVEVSELTDCIEQVAALPVLDPPIGFAQRVMTHVRELDGQPTLLQRLFLPWSKKISLPATAVVLIGIMAGVLYQKEEQLKQRALSENSTGLAAVETTKAENFPTPASVTQSEKSDKLAAAASLETAKPNVSALTKTPMTSAQSLTVKAEAGSEVEENRAAKRPPLQVQGVANSTEPSRFSGERGGFATGLSLGGFPDMGSRPASMAPERSAVPLIERSADIEFIVRRRPSLRRDPSNSETVESLRLSPEADSIPPAAGTPRTAPIAEIRFYNVAHEHYEFFKRELASEAIIESESKPAVKESAAGFNDRQLLVKVTILPPAPSESSTPTR